MRYKKQFQIYMERVNYSKRMGKLYGIDTKVKKRPVARHYKQLFKYLDNKERYNEKY